MKIGQPAAGRGSEMRLVKTLFLRLVCAYAYDPLCLDNLWCSLLSRSHAIEEILEFSFASQLRTDVCLGTGRWFFLSAIGNVPL